MRGKPKYLVVFMLFTYSVSGQLVPELYNSKIEIEKLVYEWKSKTTTITEKDNDTGSSYIHSIIEIDDKDRKLITFYNPKGNITSVDTAFFENEYLEVYKTSDGNIEETHYDKQNNKNYVKWTYPNGSQDETIYTYENNLLTKIEEKDPFDIYIEQLEYTDYGLDKIISVDSTGNIIMERRYIYDENGTLREIQRIQDDEINKSITFEYDDKHNLVRFREKKINRFTSAVMPPEIHEFQYFENGVLQSETWTIYGDKALTIIKQQYITRYNEKGLLVLESSKDLRDNTEQIYEYSYILK